MLPTPDTSHVSYSRVYEPAEDSFLLLDTLSSPSETTFLQQRFHSPATATAAAATPPPPLVVEVGTGSGVVIGFINAQAGPIFGTRDVLTLGTDVNGFACAATAATVRKAAAQSPGGHGRFLGALRGDLLAPLRGREVDVLVFNPPYVPTDELPALQDGRLGAGGRGGGWEGQDGEGEEEEEEEEGKEEQRLSASARFDRDSYLLSLSYAGGKDGMETTDRLIEALPTALSRRGCAYILLCAGNKPEEVKARILEFGPEWRVLTVGDSGKQAGWEKLQIIRIWREQAVA